MLYNQKYGRDSQQWGWLSRSFAFFRNCFLEKVVAAQRTQGTILMGLGVPWNHHRLWRGGTTIHVEVLREIDLANGAVWPSHCVQQEVHIVVPYGFFCSWSLGIMRGVVCLAFLQAEHLSLVFGVGKAMVRTQVFMDFKRMFIIDMIPPMEASLSRIWREETLRMFLVPTQRICQALLRTQIKSRPCSEVDYSQCIASHGRSNVHGVWYRYVACNAANCRGRLRALFSRFNLGPPCLYWFRTAFDDDGPFLCVFSKDCSLKPRFFASLAVFLFQRYWN